MTQPAARALLLAAAVVVLLLGLAGCDGYNDQRGRGDAPVGQVTSQPVEVVEFPDWFANVAHACDGHGHRVYVTTRDAAPVVVDDLACPGGTKETTR